VVPVAVAFQLVPLKTVPVSVPFTLPVRVALMLVPFTVPVTVECPLVTLDELYDSTKESVPFVTAVSLTFRIIDTVALVTRPSALPPAPLVAPSTPAPVPSVGDAVGLEASCADAADAAAEAEAEAEA
jgi:hypothetical protein